MSAFNFINTTAAQDFFGGGMGWRVGVGGKAEISTTSRYPAAPLFA